MDGGGRFVCFPAVRRSGSAVAVFSSVLAVVGYTFICGISKEVNKLYLSAARLTATTTSVKL